LSVLTDTGFSNSDTALLQARFKLHFMKEAGETGGVGIRVANRAGPQFQDLAWRRVEPVVAERPRWPFTVRRTEDRALFKKESADAASDKPSFSFTT
jgi:hypothetical protein